MPKESDAWFYAANGQQLGPVSREALRQLAAGGRLMPSDLIWSEGMANWTPAGQVTGLLPTTMPPRPAGGPPPLPSRPVGYFVPPPGGMAPQPDIGQDPGMRWLMPVSRSGWAIAAGYLGLFSFVFLPAPIALIISIIAIRDIKKKPGTHGMGRAVFGLIAGTIGTIGLVIAVVAIASGH